MIFSEAQAKAVRFLLTAFLLPAMGTGAGSILRHGAAFQEFWMDEREIWHNGQDARNIVRKVWFYDPSTGIKIHRKRKVVTCDDLSRRNTGDPRSRKKAHRRGYDTGAPSP